jgi:hypothetical protein
MEATYCFADQLLKIAVDGFAANIKGPRGSGRQQNNGSIVAGCMAILLSVTASCGAQRQFPVFICCHTGGTFIMWSKKIEIVAA